MKKKQIFCLLVLLLALTACGGAKSPQNAGPDGDPATSNNETLSTDLPTGEYQIKITAGEFELTATMSDSIQARDFAAQLPLTLWLYEPADFAKAFDLPEPLSDSGERTREYSIGTIAYWPEGAAVAIFFSDHAPQTVVPVIHIGQIHSGAEALVDYEGDIQIELLPDEDNDVEKESHPVEDIQLQFTDGDIEIMAALDNSPLSRELTDALPATLSMTRLYEREYYGTPLDWNPSVEYETQVEFSPGDLAYWPQGNSLLLLFGYNDEHPTIDSGIVVIGRILTDLSVFDELDGTVQMTVSVPDNA